ncbi:MAG: hypothetical protein Q7J12_03185, partial [Syntrophales bacterium]|nr:hypothetical protein [Syntrophales bacterium]
DSPVVAIQTRYRYHNLDLPVCSILHEISPHSVGAEFKAARNYSGSKFRGSRFKVRLWIPITGYLKKYEERKPTSREPDNLSS